MGKDRDRFITLKAGDPRITLVLVMQSVVNAAGIDTGVPGHFDNDTTAGVRHLQRRIGVAETGDFDEKTQLALYNLTGFELPKFHNAFHTPATRKVAPQANVPIDTEDRFAPRLGAKPRVDTGEARGK